MKNLLLYFAVFFLLHVTTSAQGSWVQQTSGTSNNLYSTYFVDSNVGWVVGASGTILYTSNSGEVWELQESGVTVDLKDVFFWDIDNGWVVGDSGTILGTADAGKHWVIQNTPVNTSLTMIQFVTLNFGFVHGNQMTSLRTTDGGVTWQGGSGDTLSADYAGFYLSDDLNNIVIILNSYNPFKYSEIHRSTDGGMTWDSSPFPYSNLVRDLHGLRVHNFLFAAAERGNIYTSYLGDFWDIGLTPDTLNFNGVTSEAESWKLWAVGESASIIFSEDSGKVWTSSSVGTIVDLYKVSFPSKDCGWAVGDSGTILHYWDSPTNLIDDKQHLTNSPAPFKLSSAYPNPFNPTTKIKFTIPTSPLNPSPYQGEGQRERLISLKVYDVLGNEITTLINEKKPAGTYEVEFDGSRLPSGVYFYQLRAGNFIETKKMLMIK